MNTLVWTILAGRARKGKPASTPAESTSPLVAELAGLVDTTLTPEHDGRTALWVAVQADMPDNARALAAAGAHPWRSVMADWSPGRLSAWRVHDFKA